jgi:hypothetical protein
MKILSIGGGPNNFDTVKALKLAKEIISKRILILNNILSIDYGERYLGLAVRTDKTTIPIPVTVIDSKKE